MGAPQYEQAGADIGGTGTTGTIPVWTGPSTLGNSLLSQSGAIVTNSGTFRADNGAVSEPAYTFSASSGTGMYRATSGALLRFAVSGAYAFGVDTSGNFGLNTTTPDSKMHVAGGASNTAFRVGYAGTSVNYLDGDANHFRDGSGNPTASIRALTLKYLDVSVGGAGWGVKLPATPGNADTQTLDCYQETTLNSGFTTSGITSTGTFTVTARATRIGRSIALTVKITPSGGASLTFASGWYVTLTGIPQMPDIAAFAAISNDATGARGSIFCDAAATPTIYGGTAGAYALGTNISLLVSGIVT